MARILSIEDDPDLQHLLCLSLRAHGYDTHYAFTGKEGYAKVLSLDPDLVIMDLNLPEMNGIEILRAMQKNKQTKDIPVIVTTAYNDPANMLADSVKALGAIEFVPKPVDIKLLTSRIKAFLFRFPKQSASQRAKPSIDLRKGAIRADPKFRTVWINDKLIATLSPKRFMLLKLLIEESGPVARPRIKSELWGHDGTDLILEKTIQRLRVDFGPEEGRRIQTTRGGYELVG